MNTTTNTKTETRLVYFLNREVTIEGIKFPKGERLINGWQKEPRTDHCFVHCGQALGCLLVPADAVDVYKRTVTVTEVTEYEAVK